MKLSEADCLARELLSSMRPYCVKGCFGGSIRRARPDVKDIELIVVPRTETLTVKTGLFGEEREYLVNLLHSWATNDTDLHPDGFQWIKTGTHLIIPWTPKPDGKYWRGYLSNQGVKVDVWLSSERNYGATQVIRTGSKEFNLALMAHAKRIGRPCEDGFFTLRGVPVETRSEQDVFDLLELQFVEPRQRLGAHCLKKA